MEPVVALLEKLRLGELLPVFEKHKIDAQVYTLLLALSFPPCSLHDTNMHTHNYTHSYTPAHASAPPGGQVLPLLSDDHLRLMEVARHTNPRPVSPLDLLFSVAALVCPSSRHTRLVVV